VAVEMADLKALLQLQQTLLLIPVAAAEVDTTVGLAVLAEEELWCLEH
jgi:hypothetical protein